MNKLLSKYRPPELTKEQWETAWKNSAYTLTPLVKVLLELRGNDTITEKELEHPNLHEKLIWDSSKRRIIDIILSIIDVSVDKSNKSM